MQNQYRLLRLKLFWEGIRTGKITVRKLANVFGCTMAYLLQLRKSAPAPFILSLELWNECNAGCLFCRSAKGVIYDVNPQGTGIMKGKMPYEMCTEIIDQLKDDVLIAVLYTNGEPLLYKDLAKVVGFATKRHVMTVIATNGLLFDEQNSRELLEAGTDFIKVQLSGYTQDIYSIQIRYGDVEKLKDNIRLLARLRDEGRYSTLIMLDYILYKYNRHQLPLIRKFCRELGLMLNTRLGNPRGGLEDKEDPLYRGELPLKVSCDWLWKAMQVNFNGEILQCCETANFSRVKPYAVFEAGKTNIREVWNGTAAVETRRLMATDGRKSMKICAQCQRQGVCFKW